MESSSERMHCFVWSSNSTERQKYFSARTHIVWHSSSVMLLKMSTSNGPPSRLFSSFTKTARPSHRRSAAGRRAKTRNWYERNGWRESLTVTHNSGKCSPSNPSWDHLPRAPGACVAWTGSSSNCGDLNRSSPNGRRMKTHSSIYLRSQSGWQRWPTNVTSEINAELFTFKCCKRLHLFNVWNRQFKFLSWMSLEHVPAARALALWAAGCSIEWKAQLQIIASNGDWW